MSTPPWVNTNQNQTTVDYSQENYDLSSSVDEIVSFKVLLPPRSTISFFFINVADFQFCFKILTHLKEAKKKHKKSSIIGGAALAGTGLGLAIAGPVVGLLGGVVAAVTATQDTKAGDVARYSGDVVLSAGDQIKDIDEKHKIVEKTNWGLGTIAGKAKEIDQNHHVVEKTKTGISNAAQKAKEVEVESYFNSITNKFRRQPDCNYTPWPDKDDQQKSENNCQDMSSNDGSGKNFKFSIPNPFRKKPDCNYTPWPEK